MRLRQLMAQAMRESGAGGKGGAKGEGGVGEGGEKGEEGEEKVDAQEVLGRVMQGLYAEGQLGSMPYRVELGRMRAREVEERKERDELRMRRSPQPVNSVLPVMRVDEGEEEEDREDDAADEEQKRAKRRAISRITQSMGVGSFRSSQPWYLYPPPCTLAGQEGNPAARRSAADIVRLERVR